MFLKRKRLLKMNIKYACIKENGVVSSIIDMLKIVKAKQSFLCFDMPGKNALSPLHKNSTAE